MTPEQEQEIARLRTLNVSPKQIARKLGLRPAEVTAEIRKQAQQLAAERGATATLAPLEACWINTNVYECLLNPDAKLSKRERKELDSGITTVAVVRKPRHNQYLISCYLVDYWCLGVKDAMKPRKVRERDYEEAIRRLYEAYEFDYQQISLEQAQAVVFSALDYAEKLGFQPHADFAVAKEQLGDRMDYLAVECGRNGQPCFFVGPYDDQDKIMETLRNSVGEGNFDYVTDMVR